MKRTIALILVLVMLASLMPVFATASPDSKPEKQPAIVNQPVSSRAGKSEEGSMDLMATVVKTVNCYRLVNYPAMTFLAESATGPLGDIYWANAGTAPSYQFVMLSDGSYRYVITGVTNGTTGETDLTVYLPASTSITEDIRHTYTTNKTHPHTTSCECGASWNEKLSDCIQCYPTKLYFYANGGSGSVPGTMTVNTDPATIPTITPKRFPYTLLCWTTDSSGSGTSYYPGKSYSFSAGKSLDLYAHWADYLFKKKAIYPPGYSTFPPFSILISPSKYAEWRAEMDELAKQIVYLDDWYSASLGLSAYCGTGYLKFVPEETATYVYESTVSSSTTGDPYGYIYNENGTVLASDDDSGSYDGNTSNFRMSYTFIEGNTYYCGLKWMDNTQSANLSVCLRKQYNITYNANGGGNAPDRQTILNGDTLTLDTRIPARDGYVFSGWSTTPDGEVGYAPGGSFTDNQDTVLYAVWSDPSGTCGENANWRFSNSDSTLYIEGSGSLYNYSSPEAVPWHAYTHLIRNIVISDEITSIGTNAFFGCSLVEEITLPSPLTLIEYRAFCGCSALKKINVPDGVTWIGEEAFKDCSAMAEIRIPDSVSSIGAGAFENCSALRAAALPSAVTSLEGNTFKGCVSLSDVQLSDNITRIGAHAFEGAANLSDLVLPGSLTAIGEHAFDGCKALQELVVRDKVTTIGRAAFANCSALRLITIPDNVTTIGTSIFAYVKDLVKVRCYIDTPIYNYVVSEGIAYELMSWGSLEPPTFSQKAISGGVSVGITSAKGTIHYTTDGSTPTAYSPVYTQEIIAQKNMVIRAIAVAEGWENSPVAELDTGIEKVEAPVANVPTGSKVEPGTQIELSCPTEGAVILCTTNGDIPKKDDVYTGPITITESTTIYAAAVKDGMLDSALTVFSYEVASGDELPVITTLDAENITQNSAKISAAVEDPESVSLVQFVYYEKNSSHRRYTVPADEHYSAVLTGLTPGTEYWFQARAVNDTGWNNGYICSFTTEEADDTRPTSIEIDPDYIALNVGKTKTLLATVLPVTANSRKISWSSEEPGVATVSSTGVVTAVGLGSTRIKATTVSGRLVAYCTVNVISSEVKGAFDFSEINMATRSSSYDPNGFDHDVNAGGNAIMSTAYLARWDGAVLEEADPYPTSMSGVKYHVLDASYHVQNVLYLPYRQNALDNDAIKSAVMEYGAVYTSMKVNRKYFTDNSTNYYLPENVASHDGGHAFVIVGWDDHYSKSNFYSTPPGDGAFICKNSWGTGSGDQGYFYVSYYDRTLARESSGDYNAVFCNLQAQNNYNKIYQYDHLGPVARQDMGTRSAYAANIFPEESSSLQEDEQLMAVSFYNYAPGTDYEIYIVTDYQNPNSLKNLGRAVKSGSLDYAGYFTVDLDTPIPLRQGTRFGVVVKYINRSNNVNLFVEVPIANHSGNARANAGESYISSNARSWTDYTKFVKNGNLCIKAFTNQPGTEDGMLLQGVDNTGRAYADDTVYTVSELEELGFRFNPDFVDRLSGKMDLMDDSDLIGTMEPSVLPDLNTNYHYSEGSQLPAVYDLRKEGYLTPVRDQGALGTCWTFATYASLESAVMKASATSANRSADGLSQAPTGNMVIELSEDGMILGEGSSAQIVASLYPLGSGKAVLWSSSNSQVAAVSAHGLVYANGIGNATITASSEDGSVSAQCFVTVTAPKPLKSVSIENTETELMVGDSLLMEVSYAPSNAAAPELTWESSDPAVASIDQYGYLEARAFGAVVITARYPDGTVAATHSLLVKGTHPYQIAIAEDHLCGNGHEVSGAVSIRAENHTQASKSAAVCIAFYSASGQMLHRVTKNVTLKAGDNTISLPDSVWTSRDGGTVLYKILLLDRSFRPLADTIEGVVRTADAAT